MEKKFLEMMGNPFDVIIFDPNGKIGLDLGVYATPETFLVNQQGVVLYKHIGAIDSEVWEEDFIPLIKKKVI